MNLGGFLGNGLPRLESQQLSGSQCPTSIRNVCSGTTDRFRVVFLAVVSDEQFFFLISLASFRFVIPSFVI